MGTSLVGRNQWRLAGGCDGGLFTDRAISYRHLHGFDHLKVALPTIAGFQKGDLQVSDRTDRGEPILKLASGVFRNEGGLTWLPRAGPTSPFLQRRNPVSF